MLLSHRQSTMFSAVYYITTQRLSSLSHIHLYHLSYCFFLFTFILVVFSHLYLFALFQLIHLFLYSRTHHFLLSFIPSLTCTLSNLHLCICTHSFALIHLHPFICTHSFAPIHLHPFICTSPLIILCTLPKSSVHQICPHPCIISLYSLFSLFPFFL